MITIKSFKKHRSASIVDGINRALNEARRSQHPLFRHGAVIMRGRREIARAVNVHKTHPKGSGFHSRMHAEFKAIRKAIKTTNIDLSGCHIFVARVDRRGNVCCSKPCPDCMKLIEGYGLEPFWSDANA